MRKWITLVEDFSVSDDFRTKFVHHVNDYLGYHADDQHGVYEYDYWYSAVERLWKEGGDIYRVVFLPDISYLRREDLGLHWSTRELDEPAIERLRHDAYACGDHEGELKPFYIEAHTPPANITIKGVNLPEEWQEYEINLLDASRITGIKIRDGSRNLVEARLDEGRLAPLYHGTSLSSALEMLHENVFWAGASLSRSIDIARHFADKTSTKLDDNRHGLTPLAKLEYEADLGTCAILVFDQEKLMHNVGLYPYNWNHHNDPNEIYKGAYEMEEVTKRNASPIDRYLTGIESYGHEDFFNIVLERMPEYSGAIEKFRSLLGHAGVLNRWQKK